MSKLEEKCLPLYPGQSLSREEFLRRWEAIPRLKFAELIGGMVYLPLPRTIEHGDFSSNLCGWHGIYATYTPGLEGSLNATWLTLTDSPQPEASVRIIPEYGGHSRLNGKFCEGAPEFVSQVCHSSEDYNLHSKLDLFQQAGVDEYLTVLLASREIRWHRLVHSAYQLIPASEDGVIRSEVFPGLWLQPQALLDGDRTLLMATLQKGLESPEHPAFVQELQRRRAAQS